MGVQSMTRVKRYQGIYQIASETRKFDGKPDVCYYVRFKHNYQSTTAKIGWRSEGVTAELAAHKRHELILQAREITNPHLQRLTLQKAFELWLERHARINMKSPIQAVYEWRSLVQPYLGDRLMDTVTPLDLEQLKGKLLARKLKPQTIRHGLSLLSRVYNKLTAWGLYEGRIPTKSVKFPPQAPPRQRWLTPDEARQLLEELELRSPDMELISLISLHTGMRWGEIAKLRGADVNLEAATIHIKDDKVGRDRTVYMTTQVRERLAKRPMQPQKLVFPGRNGQVRAAPSATYERAVEYLGFNEGVTDQRDKVVFHTLRHTFGSWLAQEGVPLYTIGQLMGHSVLETTKRYAKLCPEVKRSAIANIEKHLQPQP
jgi:integrase